jgi:hypothetical protein
VVPRPARLHDLCARIPNLPGRLGLVVNVPFELMLMSPNR